MTFTENELRVPGTVEIGGRQVERYHIAQVGTPIGELVRTAAYELLPAPDGKAPPASFAVLPHGSDTGAYLCAYSWVWGNVIECRTAAAGVPFLGCANQDPENFRPLDRPWIGCAWELAPLEHERSAWVRHGLMPASPDLDGYLADVGAEGPVGEPA